jgi:hypothetical protein
MTMLGGSWWVESMARMYVELTARLRSPSCDWRRVTQQSPHTGEESERLPNRGQAPPSPVDQWISGPVVEGARPDASNARSQRPATRATGVSRTLACVLKHPWWVLAHRCFTLPRSSILCGCINIPGRQVNAVWAPRANCGSEVARQVSPACLRPGSAACSGAALPLSRSIPCHAACGIAGRGHWHALALVCLV